MENLKIGDFIYCKHYSMGPNNNHYDYYFEEIVRITKTLIITKSGKRLQNKYTFGILKILGADRFYYKINNEVIEDINRIEKTKDFSEQSDEVYEKIFL